MKPPILKAITENLKKPLIPSPEMMEKMKAIKGSSEFIVALLASLRGPQGERGEKGDKGESIVGPMGEKGEKGDSIIGPQGIPGKDGKDGETIVGPQGERGERGEKGEPGKDAEVETIIEKIKTVKFPLEAVEGLHEELTSIKRTVREKKGGGSGGGGMGAWQHETPTGAVNGSNTAFTASTNIASSGRALIVLINGQPQRLGTHYTVSGRTVTFSTAPETGDIVFFIYVRT
jgi:hypothetical protein